MSSFKHYMTTLIVTSRERRGEPETSAADRKLLQRMTIAQLRDLYQRERIAYCKKIIAQAPGTPKARNARLLIQDIEAERAAARRGEPS